MKHKIKKESVVKENDFKLIELSATYTQPADCISSSYNDQTITIKCENILMDDVGFLVIETERWAIDDISELVDLLENFKQKLKK